MSCGSNTSNNGCGDICPSATPQGVKISQLDTMYQLSANDLFVVVDVDADGQGTADQTKNVDYITVIHYDNSDSTLSATNFQDAITEMNNAHGDITTNLSGGNTGEVLTKVSNGDYDYDWQFPPTGGVGEYTFSDDTTATDPGLGYWKTDNSDTSLGTTLYISSLNSEHANLTLLFRTAKVGSKFAVQAKSDVNTFYIFEVVEGTIVEHATWFEIPMTVFIAGVSQIVDGERTNYFTAYVGDETLEQVLTKSNDGGGFQIKNIGNPTSAQDAITVYYFDTELTNYATSAEVTSGLDNKEDYLGTQTIDGQILASSGVDVRYWTIDTGTQNLQQVTDEGNTTTNPIILDRSGELAIELGNTTWITTTSADYGTGSVYVINDEDPSYANGGSGIGIIGGRIDMDAGGQGASFVLESDDTRIRSNTTGNAYSVLTLADDMAEMQYQNSAGNLISYLQLNEDGSVILGTSAASLTVSDDGYSQFNTVAKGLDPVEDNDFVTKLYYDENSAISGTPNDGVFINATGDGIEGRNTIHTDPSTGFEINFEGNPKLILDNTNGGTPTINTQSNTNTLGITNGTDVGGANSPWIALEPTGITARHDSGNIYWIATDEEVGFVGSTINGGSFVRSVSGTGIEIATGQEDITIDAASGIIELDGFSGETLPNTSIADIDSGDNRQIATKEYANYSSVVSGGDFVTVSEGGNTGWTIRDTDRTNKGGIGTSAIDLSFADEAGDHGATGPQSFAVGYNTIAGGSYSHAEGYFTSASGQLSHAEGGNTLTLGTYSHAEGNLTISNGIRSHAEGWSTYADQAASHAEGYFSSAMGSYSHSEGNGSIASGNASHSEGLQTQSIGGNSHAEGIGGEAQGASSHAEGYFTLAIGDYSHSEGDFTVATGDNSHAEGDGTQAVNSNSHAEGYQTYAVGNTSHAEGVVTYATGNYTHSEGLSTSAMGSQSHSEGNGTLASGDNSHAEGETTIASGEYAHAEGFDTIASSQYSHAEGYNTQAGGFGTHAEGNTTRAIGVYSHAQGEETYANGSNSHAGGYLTSALGSASHAEGEGTISSNHAMHASGKYNDPKVNDIFEIGVGIDDLNRANAFEVTIGGYMYAPQMVVSGIAADINGNVMITKDYGDTSYTIGSGDTSSRPITPYLGFPYFDTDLGYQINYNGTNWVNSTGAVV